MTRPSGLPGPAGGHDHAELTHSHVPHEDLDSEHAGEAHVHHHDEPVDQDG